ncbi:MAG TPA: hypothetical protein VG890_09880 [Puia sp.]|nr:hypothetical protein [Puia sp.]
MINFCTLFDSNYLTRGLALSESLTRVCPTHHLYVIAFDDNCFETLHSARLPNLTPVSLKEFEDEKLLAVKPQRSIAEYCWTCTSSVILYCIEKYQLPSCTYIDADMIFYHDPQVLFDEMTGYSVGITGHRYTKDYDVSATHGKYCVQFVYFKNDENGLRALRWWRDRCLEWCYARLEDGKFGDQKYLDDWTERFPGVHVVQNPGAGLAPWNIQQYETWEKEGSPVVRCKEDRKEYPAIFFHFHGLKFFSDNRVACCGALYALNEEVKQVFYFPYIGRLLEISGKLRASGFSGDPQGARQAAPSGFSVMAEYLRNVLFLIKRGNLSPWKKGLFNIRLHHHIYSLNRFN